MSDYPFIFNQRTRIGKLQSNISKRISSNNFLLNSHHQHNLSSSRATTKATPPAHHREKGGHSSSDVEGGQDDQWKKLLRMANMEKGTALHYAVRYGNSLVVELLVEEDPELCNIANDANDFPLYIATARAYYGIIEKILDISLPPSSHKGPGGMTALHAAIILHLPWRKGIWGCIKQGMEETKIMEIIVRRKPEMIREKDDIGWNPFHYAAPKPRVDAVKLFLQHDGPAAYLLTNDGESALHIAALRGNLGVVKELINSSPDACELINNKKQTAPHAAVMGGSLSIVKFILGTSNLELLINQQDKDGNTDIHLAGIHRRYRIMRFLARDKRMDIELSNKKHQTALGALARPGEVHLGFLRAMKVGFALKCEFGVQSLRQVANRFRQSTTSTAVSGDVNESAENQSVKSQPVMSTTTDYKVNDQQKEICWSKKSMLETSQLVAILIATVTFTAAFTVPGGFISGGGHQEGMATLEGKAAFKAFVLFNTIAFCSSVMAVFLQFDTSLESDEEWARYVFLARYNIYVAMLGMVLAFACSTYVVLSKTAWLGVFPYALIGCFTVIYLIGRLMDPDIGAAVRILSWGRIK